jgi:hypothetical protein
MGIDIQKDVKLKLYLSSLALSLSPSRLSPSRPLVLSSSRPLALLPSRRLTLLCADLQESPSLYHLNQSMYPPHSKLVMWLHFHMKSIPAATFLPVLKFSGLGLTFLGRMWFTILPGRLNPYMV